MVKPSLWRSHAWDHNVNGNREKYRSSEQCYFQFHLTPLEHAAPQKLEPYPTQKVPKKFLVQTSIAPDHRWRMETYNPRTTGDAGGGG